MGKPISPLTVTAVVVAHNRPEELLLVIDALLSQTVLVSRVVVIDNASVRPVSGVIQPNPRVDILRSEINTGGAGGFYLGLQEALLGQADWVWLMDDDAVPASDALERLLDAAHMAPVGVGALCASVEEFGRRATFHHRRFNFRNGRETEIALSEIVGDKLVEIDTGSFVGFFVSRIAAQTVGLPISELFIGYDDTEYSLRLRAAGYLLFMVPASRMLHLTKEQSLLSSSAFGAKHYYHIRNQIYVKKTYARNRFLGVSGALIRAVAIWRASKGHGGVSGILLFGRAVTDGVFSRLGPI